MLNMAYQRKLETFETLTTTQNDTVIGGFCCSCSGSVKTALNTLFNDVTLWQHMASIEQVIMLNMRHHRKGSGGPAGLGARQRDKVSTSASTRVHTWAKGWPGADMLPYGQAPLPIPVTQSDLQCHSRRAAGCGVHEGTGPHNAAPSVTLCLFCCCACTPSFGVHHWAPWTETCAPPPNWAGSSHSPELRLSLLATAHLGSKQPCVISMRVMSKQISPDCNPKMIPPWSFLKEIPHVHSEITCMHSMGYRRKNGSLGDRPRHHICPMSTEMPHVTAHGAPGQPWPEPPTTSRGIAVLMQCGEVLDPSGPVGDLLARRTQGLHAVARAMCRRAMAQGRSRGAELQVDSRGAEMDM